MLNSEVRIKVAIVVSHPIQHFCPQFASYSKIPSVEIKVFFGSKLGAIPYHDKSFQRMVVWDNLYLEEFEHEFLNGEKLLPSNAQLDAENLEEKLKDYNPEAIVVFGYFQQLQKRAYRWARKNKVKIIYVSDSELLRKRFFGLNEIKKLKLTKYFKDVSAFLTVGDSNENYYSFYGVPFNKMFRTSFPIDVNNFQKALQEKEYLNQEIRKKFLINSNDFVICTVGKLIDFKKHKDVISSLKELDQEKERRIVYLVAGDGPERENLQHLSDSLSFHKVVFAGFVKPIDLPSFYLASNCYIHPSEIEAHSLAVSEALFLGCPILISNKCGSYGPTDDVQNGFNGFVFNVNDIRQIAQMLKLVSSNKRLLAKFSTNSLAIGYANQKLAHGVGLLKALNSFTF